jgi:hypothetical protein
MASTIRHAAAKMATTSRCGKISRREQRNRKNNSRLQIHSPKINAHRTTAVLLDAARIPTRNSFVCTRLRSRDVNSLPLLISPYGCA